MSDFHIYSVESSCSAERELKHQFPSKFRHEQRVCAAGDDPIQISLEIIRRMHIIRQSVREHFMVCGLICWFNCGIPANEWYGIEEEYEYGAIV